MSAGSVANLPRKIMARRERRAPSSSESRRMSAALHAEVVRQQAVLDACPRSHSDEEGCVYVLVQRDGAGYVKIGRTVDLEKRVGDHQSNAFGELALVAAFHGGKKKEAELHARFWRDRAYRHREHFWPSRAVLRWVDDLLRLNGRDGGLCWSCRKVGPAPLPDVSDPEIVDLRCNADCQGTPMWFHRETRLIAHGVTSNGVASTAASAAASALLVYKPQEWAVGMILACVNREADRGAPWRVSPALDRRVMAGDITGHAAYWSIVREMHWRSSIVLPHRKSPMDMLREGTGVLSENNLGACVQWANDFLRDYGVVHACDCSLCGFGCRGPRSGVRRLAAVVHTGSPLVLVPANGGDWLVTARGEAALSDLAKGKRVLLNAA